MKRKKGVGWVLLWLVSVSFLLSSQYSSVLFGQNTEDDLVPQALKLSDEEHEIVDELVIPIPLEVFSSLNELGVQNWGSQVKSREFRLNTNRSRSALLFGIVISKGFIAVQAKDKEAVKEIGRDVLKLSQALGVASSVAGHANSVISGAANGEWKDVRLELDRTRQTVLDRMRALRDDELASLVSLGGWLGGTDVLASILEENYSKEGSDLLNQPGLIHQLRKHFEVLPASAKKGSFFLKVDDTLANLEKLMATNEEGIISVKSVSEIKLATRELVNAIYES